MRHNAGRHLDDQGVTTSKEASRTEQEQGMPNPYRYVRFCAWMGPVLLVALILFWGILGHSIPPYSAALEAQAIADHFREHTTAARAGMILTMLFGVLYLVRSEEHTSELQSLMRISYAVFCLKKKNYKKSHATI